MAERERLPYIDLYNWAGLYTKGSNDVLQDIQLRVAKNTDFFNQYGALSKPFGSSRVLNAVYTEGGDVKPISWVGFYKAADLDGQILRHTLAATGTVLSRVESDGTLTALTGAGKSVTESRTSGLFHQSVQFSDFLFITNQDPDLVGNGDTLVKYNGEEILNWGVVAPGSQETVQEPFDSLSGFTISGGSVSASLDTTTTQDGTSIKLDTIDAAANVEKNITNFSVSTAVTNRGSVFIYIPRGQIPNVANTSAVQVFIGSDASLATNFYQFDFDVGDLLEGWNQLFLDFKAAEDGTNTKATKTGTPVATSLESLRFRVTPGSGKTVNGIRWDKFFTFDEGILTAAEGSSGTVFANAAEYQYRVTFVSKTGALSNAGPATATLTLTAGRDDLSLSGIPTSNDPQVTARQIYRTVNGGTVFLFVDSIEDNTTTTFTDTTADTALSQTQPPFEGDASDDNTPPPKGGIVKVWKRTVFISGKPDDPNSIFWSEDDEGESFPTLNTATLDDKVTGLYETYSGLVAETETGKWQITGENPDFRFDKIITQIGCVGRRAQGEGRILGWSIDRDGVRLYDLNNPQKISENIRDKFDTDFDKTNIELLHSAHCKCNNSLFMFVPDANGDYTSNNYVYQYPLDDFSAGWWWQLDLPSSVNIQHLIEREDANGDFQIIGGASDGMIYRIFDPAAKNWATAASTEAITTEFQTKRFRLGSLGADSQYATGRVLPRMLEIRHSGDATTWTAVVETANGSAQSTATDSKTITLPFAGDSSNESLLRYPIPSMQQGEYCGITLTNSDTDVSSVILGVRLYVKVFPGQFPLESGDMNDQV